MNKMAFNSVLIASLTLGLSLPSHAGLFGSKKESPSYESSAVSQLAALKAQGMSHDFEPIEVGRLKNADCTDLSVYAANAKREMKSLLNQADQYDAQQSQNAKPKKSGGFMSGLMTVANLAAKGATLALTGDTEMMQMTSQITNALSTANNIKNSINAQKMALTSNSLTNQENDADYILKRYKKHEADLENIQVYQNSKQCL